MYNVLYAPDTLYILYYNLVTFGNPLCGYFVFFGCHDLHFLIQFYFYYVVFIFKVYVLKFRSHTKNILFDPQSQPYLFFGLLKTIFLESGVPVRLSHQSSFSIKIPSTVIRTKESVDICLFLWKKHLHFNQNSIPEILKPELHVPKPRCHFPSSFLPSRRTAGCRMV